MKNKIPKTMRKGPKILYEVKFERGKWYAYREGAAQGFNNRHSGALGIAIRHANADADVGMKPVIETVMPDGTRTQDWSEQ